MSRDIPLLFDPRLRRRNLRRAAGARPGFLAEMVAAEIASRASLILREFALTLIHGPGAAGIRSALGSDHRFGRIVTAGPVSEPGLDLVFEDEALPLAPCSIDCLISIFGLGSTNDVPGALAQIRQSLRPDGLFLACLFTGATLVELREAWLAAESDVSGGVSPRSAPLADLRDLGGLLQRAGFALPAADADTTLVRYPNALALMREIKALGFGHALAHRSRKPVTATLVARAAAIYDQRFADSDGKVRATVETAWIIGWAPHESQQRPLRPGSAKTRLADALKTEEVKLRRD